MAISLASLRTTTALTPPRILIHGVAGVGKSTFAADADRPVFIRTEDGLGKLQVPHFPLATSYAEVAEALELEAVFGPGAAQCGRSDGRPATRQRRLHPRTGYRHSGTRRG